MFKKIPCSGGPLDGELIEDRALALRRVERIDHGHYVGLYPANGTTIVCNIDGRKYSYIRVGERYIYDDELD